MLISKNSMLVSSVSGQSAWFEAGVAREVPQSLVDQCIELGAYPHDQKEPAVVDAGDQIEVNEVSNEDRIMEVVSACEVLVAEGNEANFSKNDEPKVRALENVLGYDITADQRDEAWAELSRGK